MIADSLPSPQAESVGQQTDQSILIVEDERDQADILSQRLESLGYATRSVSSGHAALRAAFEDRPQLICLDIGLPDISGLEICERLSDDPRTCTTPIIILSGAERANLIRTVRSVGAQFFLRKPYDPNALLVLVQAALNGDR